MKNSLFYQRHSSGEWRWSRDKSFRSYFCTNVFGDGVFYVDLNRNIRIQLVGTWDFSLFALKDPHRKIRRWMSGVGK